MILTIEQPYKPDISGSEKFVRTKLAILQSDFLRQRKAWIRPSIVVFLSGIAMFRAAAQVIARWCRLEWLGVLRARTATGWTKYGTIVIHYLLPLPDPFFSYLKEFNRRHMSLEEASISKQSKSRSIQILNSVYVRCWMIIVEEND